MLFFFLIQRRKGNIKIVNKREYRDTKFVICNIPLRKRKGTLGSLSIFVGVFEDTIAYTFLLAF